MQTATNSTTKTNSAARGQDATTLLRADHKLVSGLFAQYEKTQSTAKKKQLVAQSPVVLKMPPTYIVERVGASE